MKKPIIGINAELTRSDRRTLTRSDSRTLARLDPPYYQAIEQAGGVPLIIPPLKETSTIKTILKSINGLLISGGDDIIPGFYGEKPLPQTKPVLNEKQKFDLTLIKLAWQKRIPTLAICQGSQLLNVAQGGTLFQDIPTQLSGLNLVRHRKSFHKVYLAEGTLLHKMIGQPLIQTNSFHHQTIKRVGRNLRICAKSEDGLIEGVESTRPGHFMMGVQWHPERIIKQSEHLKLLQQLIKASKKTS